MVTLICHLFGSAVPDVTKNKINNNTTMVDKINSFVPARNLEQSQALANVPPAVP